VPEQPDHARDASHIHRPRDRCVGGADPKTVIGFLHFI